MAKFLPSQLRARQDERDRAEQDLRQSEERYRLLFDQNPQSMWVYDLETLEFLEVNEAAVRAYRILPRRVPWDAADRNPPR